MTKRRTSPSRRRKLREIATKAANKMARKTSWCQGSWAQTKGGDEYGLSIGANECTLPSRAKMEAEAPDLDPNYFEANSPRAAKFCVEGMIYNAAGKVYKRLRPGFAASRVVIELLNEKVAADPETDYNDAMSLNDSNGDASRQRLADHLREVAKDLA